MNVNLKIFSDHFGIYLMDLHNTLIELEKLPELANVS